MDQKRHRKRKKKPQVRRWLSPKMRNTKFQKIKDKTFIWFNKHLEAKKGKLKKFLDNLRTDWYFYSSYVFFPALLLIIIIYEFNQYPQWTCFTTVFIEEIFLSIIINFNIQKHKWIFDLFIKEQLLLICYLVPTLIIFIIKLLLSLISNKFQGDSYISNLIIIGIFLLINYFIFKIKYFKNNFSDYIDSIFDFFPISKSSANNIYLKYSKIKNYNKDREKALNHFNNILFFNSLFIGSVSLNFIEFHKSFSHNIWDYLIFILTEIIILVFLCINISMTSPRELKNLDGIINSWYFNSKNNFLQNYLVP